MTGSTNTKWLWWAVGAIVVIASASLAWLMQPDSPSAPQVGREATATNERYEFPSVRLMLVGITSNNQETSALISVDDQPAKPFSVEQEIASGIRLVKIEPARVVVRYRDLARALFLQTQPRQETPQAASAAAQRDENSAFARNPDIDPLSLNLTDLATAKEFLSDVTVKRHPDGGFVVQEVDAESFYAKLGLQPGDIVHNMDPFAKYARDRNARMMAIYAGDAEMEVIRDGGVVILKHRPE